MKVFVTAVIAVAIIAAASQFVLTHYVGESSDAAYSDRSTRP